MWCLFGIKQEKKTQLEQFVYNEANRVHLKNTISLGMHFTQFMLSFIMAGALIGVNCIFQGPWIQIHPEDSSQNSLGEKSMAQQTVGAKECAAHYTIWYDQALPSEHSGLTPLCFQLQSSSKTWLKTQSSKIIQWSCLIQTIQVYIKALLEMRVSKPCDALFITIVVQLSNPPFRVSNKPWFTALVQSAVVCIFLPPRAGVGIHTFELQHDLTA